MSKVPLHLVVDSDRLWKPSSRQLALIEALLTYPFPTLRDASTALKIPESTAWRWNADQRFQSHLHALAEERWADTKDSARRRLRGMVGEAIRVKEEVLHADLGLAAKASDWILERFVLPEKGEDMEESAFEEAVLAAIAEVAPEVQRAVIAALRRQERTAS